MLALGDQTELVVSAHVKVQARPLIASGVATTSTQRPGDAEAAIRWLCDTFGFEKHLVVPGPNGTIVHAQLSFGNGMIMLGSAVDSEWGRLMKQPDEIGGAATQRAHVVVADADEIHRRARLALRRQDEHLG